MKVLFVVFTGHDDVLQKLPLVEELLRRGHDVRCATAADHAALVGTTGAGWVELPYQPFLGGPEQWFPHWFAATRATHPVLLDECRRDRPDVVVYSDQNWPAKVVARQLGIPAVRAVRLFAHNEHFPLEIPDRARKIEDDCARFAAEQGVALTLESLFDEPEECDLVFVPREFQPAGDTFGETVHFVGPPAGRLVDEYWTPRYELPEVSDAIDVQPWFLQPADPTRTPVLITGGDSTSVLGAVREGVPLVVVPVFSDEIADRVADLGLGERVDDLQDLRAAVDRVSAGDRIRRNVDRMRAAVHRAGGVVRAADLVEAVAR
ncbi:hypothetical protein BBK82_32250 [Lentzea guizhouensis]|uniref:Glycosyl transferase n=1 Tax=Lentzea guizhouensis TaxID=1586287 RepID=A0A1B2HQM1_9PSEU|nr:hypothetical protein [Lentzea guizhouensis]ANZ40019.1 hypothetical protein BBK82_32250 [Lentzea guizhouensis]